MSTKDKILVDNFGEHYYDWTSGFKGDIKDCLDDYVKEFFNWFVYKYSPIEFGYDRTKVEILKQGDEYDKNQE